MSRPTTTLVDVAPFAPADLTGVPDLALFFTYYGVRLSNIGEDGDVVILGHPGKLRVVAAMRAWQRENEGSSADADESLRRHQSPREPDPDPIVDEFTYTWAVLRTHCDEHPECSIDDGFPCHDDDRTGYPEHDWSEWRPWPTYPGQRSNRPDRSRNCRTCNMFEVDPPPATPSTPPRCRDCAEIAECAWWLNCHSTPDTPGAFPVTYWSA